MALIFYSLIKTNIQIKNLANIACFFQPAKPSYLKMKIDFYSFDCISIAIGYRLGVELNRFYQTSNTSRYLEKSIFCRDLNQFFSPSSIAITALWRLHSAMIGEINLMRRSSALLFSTKSKNRNTIYPCFHIERHRSPWVRNSIYTFALVVCCFAEHFVADSSKDITVSHKRRSICRRLNPILFISATLITSVATVALVQQKQPLLPLAIVSGVLITEICRRYAPVFYRKKFVLHSNVFIGALTFIYSRWQGIYALANAFMPEGAR